MYLRFECSDPRFLIYGCCHRNYGILHSDNQFRYPQIQSEHPADLCGWVGQLGYNRDTIYGALYADSEDSEGRNLADVLETIDEANPENLFISQEDREDFKRKVNETLSKMEQEVLSYYLQGFRYEQIAEAMGKEPKAVDNALQRLKKKLKGK